MKFNKLFFAALAFATVAMIGCKKDQPTPVDPQGGGDEIEIPQIDAPAAGNVILAVYVDKSVNVCNTIALRGEMTSWADGDPIIFTKIADAENWYKAEFDATLVWGNSKLMLVDTEGSTHGYDYEAAGGAYELLNGTDAYLALGNDFGTENCLNTVTDADLNGKILYVSVKEFKGNPCVAKSNYTITLMMPYPCEDGFVPAVCGSFNSWDNANPIAMESSDGVTWTVTVEAQAGNEFKFETTEGNWANEIYYYDEGAAEWKKSDNIKLDANLNPTFDYSDPAKYMWYKMGVPLPPPPGPTGEMWIKCAGNGWSWEMMDMDGPNSYSYLSTVTDESNIGANINTTGSDAGAVWFDLGGDYSAAGHGFSMGQSIKYVFTGEDPNSGTLEVVHPE